jgi:PPOX class probable F420-dependent enzyme
MGVSISSGFQKLLREPAYCEIATLMRDGSPHIAQVWVDTDGEHILINVPEGTQKLRNVRRDPRVAVNVVDPKNPYRIAAVRGKVAEVTTEGADDHIDRLAYKYLGQEKYPFRQPGQIRVMLKVTPEKINEIGTDGSA